MRYRLALGGFGLTAVAVLAAGGCRAARPAAMDDAALWHRGTQHLNQGQGYRLATPAPEPRTADGGHAAPPPAARPAPRPAPLPIRVLPPRLRHLPPLQPRGGDWRPLQPPVHACSTVSLGRGGGTSVQCVQRSDDVYTKSDTHRIRDDWPDRGWSDGDQGGRDRDWPRLGWGHDD